MKNTLGNNIKVTLFGESHGPYIGAVLDGMMPGIKINYDFINQQLIKRRPKGKSETNRVEQDKYQIISGVFNDYTTGAPLCVIIPNENISSKDYNDIKNKPRPSHADYVAHVKYHGFEDYRGGGHFSGRITTPLVVIGAIIIDALKSKNIYIGTHIKKCGSVIDRDFINHQKDIEQLQSSNYPVLENIEQSIINEIENVRLEQNSIGGIVQTSVVNLPIGLGEPWFSSVEGTISNAVFAIGGVKGIEFGDGFNFSNLTGKTANDEFEILNNKIVTKTNHNGGINGGITNGMPIVFNTAIKPTPSISSEQNTVDLLKNENTKLIIEGRHDPAIIRRICVVIDSVVAIVIADMLAMRYGNDFLDFEE